jgi:hypothetical protein
MNVYIQVTEEIHVSAYDGVARRCVLHPVKLDPKSLPTRISLAERNGISDLTVRAGFSNRRLSSSIETVAFIAIASSRWT